jgi:glycosyltransferase involved in cell wall biosynthesis
MNPDCAYMPGNTVNVVIPAFQAARTIAAAVQSALEQTRQDVSVTVVNDGSPDSAELEIALQPFLSSIVYIVQRNRGVSLARNAAILASNTDWVAFLDADDTYYPHGIERLVALATAEQASMVYGNGTITGNVRPAGSLYMDFCPSTGAVTAEALITGTCIPLTSAVLVRRSAVIEAGLFDASQHQAEDLDLWLRLVLNGHKVAYTRDPVIIRDEQRGIGAGSDTRKMLNGVINVMQRVAARKDIDAPTRASALHRIDEANRIIRSERIKAYPVISSVVRSSVWCRLRHRRIGGQCPECDA